MIDVCLAGTGGMMPLKNRWLTTCYMEYNGKGIIIDCGEGTQIALAAAECKLSRLEALFITHFHADHISGLPGLLLSLGNYSKTTPLKIYGPKGIKNIVYSLCCICRNLPFPLEIIELERADIVLSAEYIDSMLEIGVLPLKHTVSCLGYSFTFGRKPVFNPDKALSLNIPQKYWRVLHSGESIELEDGKIITTDMVTDGQRASVKLTYVTDTIAFDDIAGFAHNSDLFICEGMYGDDENDESMKEKGHMLFSDAAKLAQSACVKELWLTHYSPAMQNPLQYKDMVKGIFENTVISRDGQRKEI